jgi:tetratricopeptide (TPR) repeat protein
MAATDRITIPVLAAMAVTCHAGGAAAQDVAAAEALFDRGVEEMKAGRYEKGCPALAESYRIDPRPGALFTLAECENKRGKIATAVARYEEYLRLVATLAPAQIERQRERIDIANKQKACQG